MAKKENIVSRETKQITALGRSFRIRRQDQGLNLMELAEKTGLASWTISKLEKGILPNTSLLILNKVADALEMKITITAEPKRYEPTITD